MKAAPQRQRTATGMVIFDLLEFEYIVVGGDGQSAVSVAEPFAHARETGTNHDEAIDIVALRGDGGLFVDRATEILARHLALIGRVPFEAAVGLELSGRRDLRQILLAETFE